MYVFLFSFLILSFFINITPIFSNEKNIYNNKNFLVMSHDDLFKKSEPGKAIFSNFVEKRNKLLEESKNIEETFVSEELLLTKKRENLSSDEFQKLANDFDKKVEITRKNRLERDRSLQNDFNIWKQNFVKIILPIVKKIMSDYGASVVLDTSTRGIIYEQNIDITSDVIIMLNKVYKENPEIFRTIVEGEENE